MVSAQPQPDQLDFQFNRSVPKVSQKYPECCSSANDLVAILETSFRDFINSSSENKLLHFSKVQQTFSAFQENPYLLDKRWQFFIDSLQDLIFENFANSPASTAESFEMRLIYSAMTVRGKRAIQMFLKCGLNQIWLLKHLNVQLSSPCWECQFVAFIWLSQFLLVPFPLREKGEFSGQFFISISQIALSHLSSSGSLRNAAGIFLGTFYARPEFGIKMFIMEGIEEDTEYQVLFLFVNL